MITSLNLAPPFTQLKHADGLKRQCELSIMKIADTLSCCATYVSLRTKAWRFRDIADYVDIQLYITCAILGCMLINKGLVERET